MVKITAAVKHHAGDSFFFCAIGDHLPDELGSVDVAALAAQVLLVRSSRCERVALGVVNHLSVDVLDTAENSQTGTRFASRHTAADAFVNAKPDLVFRISGHYL